MHSHPPATGLPPPTTQRLPSCRPETVRTEYLLTPSPTLHPAATTPPSVSVNWTNLVTLGQRSLTVCAFLCDWLISPSITSSRCTHVAACVRISPLPFGDGIIFHRVYGPHPANPFIRWRTRGRLHCLAAVNNAAVNGNEHTSLETLLSSLELLHHMVI